MISDAQARVLKPVPATVPIIASIAGIAILIIEKSIDSIDRSTRGVLSQLQCA
jgi:hypothetical protein